jgi:hypothetical protein
MNIPGSLDEHFQSSVNPNDFYVAPTTFTAGPAAYDPNMYGNVVDSVTDQAQIAADNDLASAELDADYLKTRSAASLEQARIDAQAAADYNAQQAKIALAYQATVQKGIDSNDTRGTAAQTTFQKAIDNAKITKGSGTGGDGGDPAGGGGATMPPRESLASKLGDMLSGIMQFVLVALLIGGIGVGIKYLYDNPDVIKKITGPPGPPGPSTTPGPAGQPMISGPQGPMPKYRSSREPPL